MMPAGRPTKYNPEVHLPQVELMAEMGLTVEQIADRLDVATSTVSKWMAEDAAFSEAIKRGRALSDERVEASLYQRATGYNHKATKIFMPAGATAPVYAPYVEHTPPDPTAMIFWLKNRKPKEWRDRAEIEVEVTDLTKGMTHQQKKARIEEILANRKRTEGT